MEEIKFDYSMKNIPLPNRENYLKKMIHEVQLFFQRFRWRFFWVNNDKPTKEKQTYGFKTEKSAPANNEMTHYENDIIHLISNIEYRDVTNEFQNKLLKDVKKIRNSKKSASKC